MDDLTREKTYQDEIKTAIDESITNIHSLFNILKARVQELYETYRDTGNWNEYNINDLKQNFFDVFSAMEKNSKGRYQIVYNMHQQTGRDYLVDLQIESVEGDTITIPPVLQDCFRDLIANARKYTLPGGFIYARMQDDGQYITIIVRDNGVGIPEDQIEKVVAFGYRADNVSHIKSMGGGFGLTKAYEVTKQCGGRFWIDTDLGAGTEITMRIPRPKS
jgi:signal transduction histidine kinase